MFCVDDIKSCIQEWFAETLSPVEVAKTYHVVMEETEIQLDYMMRELTKNKEN